MGKPMLKLPSLPCRRAPSSPAEVRLNLPAPNFRDGPKIQLCAVVAPGMLTDTGVSQWRLFNNGVVRYRTIRIHTMLQRPWPRLCLVWLSRSPPKFRRKRQRCTRAVALCRMSPRVNSAGVPEQKTRHGWPIGIEATRHTPSDVERRLHGFMQRTIRVSWTGLCH
jgi:hypothetical protein